MTPHLFETCTTDHDVGRLRGPIKCCWNPDCDDFIPDDADSVNLVNGCVSLKQRLGDMDVGSAVESHKIPPVAQDRVLNAFRANESGRIERYIRADIIRQVCGVHQSVPEIDANIPPIRLIGEREYRRIVTELLTHGRRRPPGRDYARNSSP